MQTNSCRYFKNTTILLVFIVLFFCNINLLNATSFGSSCHSAGSIGPNQTSGFSDSLYNYLQDNICISQTSCQVNDSNLTICVRNDNNTDSSCVPNQSCTEYQLGLNQNISLASFTNNTFLSTENNVQNINVTINQVDKNVCLMIETVLGAKSIICKTTNVTPPTPPENPTCTNVADVCSSATSPSKSIFNFSGRSIQCLRETLNSAFFGNSTCRQVSETQQLNSISPFFVFQKSIKTTIFVALTLYIMFFGIKLMYEPEAALERGGAVMFLLKLVLVQYFAVGTLPQYFNFGDVTSNGVTEIVMPLILELMSGFSNIMLQAASSSLNGNFCFVDTDSYDAGYSYYAMWDSLDCRIGYYLGYYPSDVNLPDSNDSNFPKDWFKDKMAIFGIMAAATWMGSLVVLICMIFFVKFLLEIVFKILMSFIIAILNLYMLAYLSPIFIPMYLFEYTKQYYEGWKNLLLSCCIQPLILTAYLTMALVFFDQTVYKKCEFTSIDSPKGKYYVISETSTSDPKYDTNCHSSIGYMVYQLATGNGWSKKTHFLFDTYEFDASSLASEVVYLVLFFAVFSLMLKSMCDLSDSISAGLGGVQKDIGKGVSGDLKEGSQPIKDLGSGAVGLAKGVASIPLTLAGRAAAVPIKAGARKAAPYFNAATKVATAPIGAVGEGIAKGSKGAVELGARGVVGLGRGAYTVGKGAYNIGASAYQNIKSRRGSSDESGERGSSDESGERGSSDEGDKSEKTKNIQK